MKELNLQNKPYQTLEFFNGADFFEISLFTFGQFTLAGVSLNGESLASGVLCVADSPLLFDARDAGGNFVFECVEENYPYFKYFNKSQRLLFKTLEELENAG